MKGETKRNEAAKLLAITMVLALAFVAVGATTASGIETDAEGAASPTLPESEGVITLDKDYELTESLDVDGATTLDLNGHTLSISVSAEGEDNITALKSNGALDIISNADTKGTLDITVTGKCKATSGSEHVYGINAGGDLEISNVHLDITVSTADPYAFAIGGNTGTKTFNSVTGQITGGNRGIQMGGAALTFTDSELTITGGEKAVQAKTSGVAVTLTNSEITMDLMAYPGSNTGDNDLFAMKLDGDLNVNSASVLKVQGLRLMSSATVDGVDGKVIITGDYDQNAEAAIPVKIAGLYSDIATEISVKKIDSESAATAGLNILSGDVYGANVKVDEKSQVTASTASEVTTELGKDDTTTVTYIGTDKITVTVPSNKTLVLTDVADQSEITLSEGSVLSIGANFSGDKTITVKNGNNQAVLKNVPANVQILKGSIVIVGSLSGEYTVSGDVKLQGSVNNDLTIKSTDRANVVLDDGFSVASGTALTFDGVSVSSVSPVTNNGTIDFGTTTEIDGTFSVIGGTITGTVKSGSLILSPSDSDITVTGTNLIINDDARMTVSSNVTLTGVTNNGTITLYGELAGTIVNYGVINVAESGSIDASAGVTGTGTINNSKTSEATLSGDLLTTTTFEQFQIITVTGDLTITEGTVLTIKGSLIIPEGVKVTIEKEARLIMKGQAASLQNAGEIIVQSVLDDDDKVGGLVASDGAKVINNGIIEAAFDLEDGATVANVINIEANSKLENNKIVKIDSGSQLAVVGSLVNAASAEVIINGNLSGNITNSGKVTVNGTVAAASISMVASGASVEIVSVEGSELTVDDSGLKVGTKTVASADVDSLKIIPRDNYAFKGLIVSVEASVKDNKLIKTFSVGGAAVYSYTGDGVAPEVTDSSVMAEMEFKGKDVVVSDTLSVVRYITFTNNAIFKVSGELKAYDITNSGTLTVTGLVDVDNKINDGTINAAMYTTEATVASATVKTYHYTTLANAVASGSKAIDVFGAVSVDTQFTVEKDIVITMASGSELTIKKDGFITVADGAKINGSGDIKVNGNLYYTVEKTGKKGYTGTITSEVYSTDDTDALYTNLVSAMAAAQSGETITLNGNAKLELTSFTVKDGVTLKTAGKTLTVNGSTLTIDGTLDLESASNLVVSAYTYTGTGLTVNSSVVLNGLIQSQSSIPYSVMNIAGAYYSVLKDGVQINCITTVAKSAAVASDAVGQKIILEGDLTAGDVTFTGKADEPVTVVVNGKLTADKIILKDAIMTVDGKTFVGTVANAAGSVSLSDASYSGVKFVDKTADGKEKLTLSGQISDVTNKKASVVVNGTVYADNLTVSYLKVAGTLEVAGTVNINKTLTVDGTVNINAGKSLVATGADSVVVVMGTFTVAEATSTTSAGTASISKLFVGLTSEDTTGASAVVSGNVVLSVTSGSVKPVAYVLAGSEIPESITKATGVKKTEFYVDGGLWMTAYGIEGSTFDVKKAPVVDADFKSWQTADKKTEFSDTTEVGWNAIPAGTDALYAEVDYNVYTVKVITDGGFSSVSIDGNIMTGMQNEFTMNKIAAGTHKLSATIKAGYEGSAVITIDGKTIAGDSFTISGDDREVVINLSGTSPASSTVVIDDGKTDGMGLTDILLIVLVVLIAVMAIMVALRMMRS